MSGIIKVRKKENPFEMIERATLQDTRLSLQALGLLVNVCSYPDSWEIYKTELYKRYPKNKETSVRSAWNELLALDYAMEKKIRTGRKWSYEYAVSTVPFTEEEKVQFLGTNLEEEQGSVQSVRTGFSGPQNGDLKMGTSKSSGNRYNIKENTHKENTHKNNTHLSISEPVKNFILKNNINESYINDIEKLDGLIDDKTYLCFKVSDAIKNQAKDLYAYVKKSYVNDQKSGTIKQPDKPTRTEYIPEHMQEDFEQPKNDDPEIDAKRAALKAKLDKLKGDKS